MKSFYPTFKSWVESKFPAGVEWNELIAEDENHQYDEVIGNAVEEEVELEGMPCLDGFMNPLEEDQHEVEADVSSPQYSFN